MSRLPARLLAVTATTAVATALLAPPSPAGAGDMSFSKSSGRYADLQWLEVGELPPAANAPGNAHFGFMIVEETSKGRATAFGNVVDVQCDGTTPPYLPGFGHHVEPAPEEGPCVTVGVRFVEGGSLSFSLDNKLSAARITGTLAVGDGHGGPTGAPAVDITLAGTGSTTTQRSTFSYRDEFGSYSYRYTSTGRSAVVQRPSAIGPMGFDDEDGEYSSAFIGTYKSVSRSRG